MSKALYEVEQVHLRDWTEIPSTPIPHPTDRYQDESPARHNGKRWITGFWNRLPLTSLICLIAIIASGAGCVIVLLNSDGKDVDSWCTGTIDLKLPGGDRHKQTWRITVSVWLALLVFIAGRALAVMYTEALAISWWVLALDGQTLRELHYKWEAGQSVFTAMAKPTLLSWICVASVAYTAFTGLEALLQNASSSTTVLSTYPANMTADMANNFPNGFSGIYASPGHDIFDVTYLTPEFIDVLQNHTTKSNVQIELEGCEKTSNVSCATTLTGIGFGWTCNSSRTSLQKGTLVSNGDVLGGDIFNVEVDWPTPWAINLITQWKDKPDPAGASIISQNCTLVPALVEYPVNVTQGIAILRPALGEMNWTSNLAPIASGSQFVDKVKALFPVPSFEPASVLGPNVFSGSHSTLGGIYLALSNLFSANINISGDMTNFGARVTVTGAFAASFARFENGTGNEQVGYTIIQSPMDQLVSDIREIMFRSSIAIASNNITDWARGTMDNRTTNVPKALSTNLGQYNIYHTVYKTDHKTMAIVMTILSALMLAIIPLYWRYWQLGRAVSLSPIEIAQAMHNGHLAETERLAEASDVDLVESRDDVQEGSNHEAKDLVKILRDKKIRYGETNANILGFGHFESVTPPTTGNIYH